MKKDIKSEKEKCVSCGKIVSGITKYTHIDFRDYYIEGAGQLCKECYNKIYCKDTAVSSILDNL